MDFGLARSGDDGDAPASAPVRRAAPRRRAGADDSTSTRDRPTALDATQVGRTLGATRAAAAQPHADGGGDRDAGVHVARAVPGERRPTRAPTSSASASRCTRRSTASGRSAGASLEELTENVVTGRMSSRPPSRRCRRGCAAVARARAARRIRRRATRRWRRCSPSSTASPPRGTRRLRERRGGQAGGRLGGARRRPRREHAPSKSAMREAFLATGKAYAADAFAGASAVLDRYARRWTELYVDVCEATHLRGEQSAEVLDLRMTCLIRGARRPARRCAGCSAPRRPRSSRTPSTPRPRWARSSAVRTSSCCAPSCARPRTPRSARPSRRCADALVDVRALAARRSLDRRAGGVGAAGRGGASAGLRARAGRGAARARRRCSTRRARTSANAALEEAVWAAELARHDEVASRGGEPPGRTSRGTSRSRFEVAEIWGRHVETLLRRMGGHDLLWGWYFNNRSAVREQQGRLHRVDRGHAPGDRRQGARAGADGARRGQPASATSRTSWRRRGDFAAALEASQRAVDIVGAGLGPDHPRTAIYPREPRRVPVPRGPLREARRRPRRRRSPSSSARPIPRAWVTYPLLTLGLSHLGTGRFEEARSVLERAARIRDALREDARAPRRGPLRARARPRRGAGEPTRAIALGASGAPRVRASRRRPPPSSRTWPRSTAGSRPTRSRSPAAAPALRKACPHPDPLPQAGEGEKSFSLRSSLPRPPSPTCGRGSG